MSTSRDLACLLRKYAVAVEGGEEPDGMEIDHALEAAAVMRKAADEIVRLGKIEASAMLYRKWATKTGNYPHDEAGCEAHQAIIDATD